MTRPIDKSRRDSRQKDQNNIDSSSDIKRHATSVVSSNAELDIFKAQSLPYKKKKTASAPSIIVRTQTWTAPDTATKARLKLRFSTTRMV